MVCVCTCPDVYVFEVKVCKMLDYEMHHDMDVKRFCIDAERDTNRESATYADCRLFRLSWTIKLCRDVAPKL